MTSFAGVLLLLALAVDPGATISGETAAPASGSVLTADPSLAPLWSALRALDLATARGATALRGLHVIPLPNGLALAGTF